MKLVIQFCILATLLLSLNQGGKAQEIVWGGGVGFGDTKIRHGEAIVPDGIVKFDRSYGSLVIDRPNVDAASVVRMLKLVNGRAIVYKLAVKRLENGARFEVLLQPHEPTAKQIGEWGIDPARVEKDFLSKYTQPIMLNSSDIIAVDVLIDTRTGAKLVDFFQISNGPPITRRNPEKLKAEARALTLDDLALAVTGYEVRRNGESLYASGGGASGRYIWLGIPQVGRVDFTLTTPPAGSGFEHTAIVNEKQLVFWLNGVQYEWLSKERIVPAEGSFYVWLKFDPTFSLPPAILERTNNHTGWSHGAFDKLPGEKKEE